MEKGVLDVRDACRKGVAASVMTVSAPHVAGCRLPEQVPLGPMARSEVLKLNTELYGVQ